MSFPILVAVAASLAFAGALLVWLSDKVDLRLLKPLGTLLVLGAVLFVMRSGTPPVRSEVPAPAVVAGETPVPTGLLEAPRPAPSTPPTTVPVVPGSRGGATVSPSPSGEIGIPPGGDPGGYGGGNPGPPAPPDSTRSPTPSHSPTPSSSPPPDPSPSESPSPSPTESPSPSPTESPSPSPTDSPTPSPTTSPGAGRRA